MKNKINFLIIITGIIVGIAAILLTKLGNPANMGFCIACFLRDISGSLKLHSAPVVQYFRPEIVGIIIGALLMALFSGEWKAKAGSSPATRFILGFFVMIGALAFLGCPLRMVIRMGSGDLNAFVGFAGFVVGILIGIFFLKAGFTLSRNYEVTKVDGFIFPIMFVMLLVVFLMVGYFSSAYIENAKAVAAGTEGAKAGLFPISLSGPGSMHAPFAIAFVIAIIVGVLAQKSRMCMVGGLRDVVMFKDFTLILGFAAIFVAVLVGNIVLGKFKGFSTVLQPISHSSHIWNFLGMLIVGWGSCLLGGCPLRQLILAGEGNADSALTVIGMIVGAAFSHNFGLAGSADSKVDDVIKVGGISSNGQKVVILGLIILLAISVLNTYIKKNEVKK